MENLGPLKEMISVNKAIKIILSQAKTLPKEKILSVNSLGRILSENIYAKIYNIMLIYPIRSLWGGGPNPPT